LILLYFAATLSSRWLDGRATLRSAKSYLFDFGVALVACVVTPNHVFGLIFPLIYIQKAFSSNVNYLTNISEWQPAGLSTPLGQMITFYLLFCGFALAGSRRSPRPIHIGLLVAFAYGSIRNIPLLGIAATPVLARHLPPALGRAWRAITSRTRLLKLSEQLHDRSISLDRRSRGLLLPSVAAALLAFVFILPPTFPAGYTALSGISRLSDLSPGFHPGKLMDKLAEKDGDVRVFNYFNWGGAFIWRLYPRIKVFIDQRNDCYPMQVFKDYFAVHRLERDWREVLERWKIDAVAYPRHARLTEALRTENGWRVVYDGDDGVLFDRVH